MRSHEFVAEGSKSGPGATDARRWAPDQPLPAGWLQAWRGDVRTGTIETLPLSFNPNGHMTKMLSAYKWARDQKLLPVIPPETWAMLAMVEGREDFGYNFTNKHIEDMKLNKPKYIDINKDFINEI